MVFVIANIFASVLELPYVVVGKFLSNLVFFWFFHISVYFLQLHLFCNQHLPLLNQLIILCSLLNYYYPSCSNNPLCAQRFLFVNNRAFSLHKNYLPSCYLQQLLQWYITFYNYCGTLLTVLTPDCSHTLSHPGNFYCTTHYRN